jgi:hypothetical protein
MTRVVGFPSLRAPALVQYPSPLCSVGAGFCAEYFLPLVYIVFDRVFNSKR